MELRQLEYFAAVARHRHFTRASHEVQVAQPALSQQIRRLERELGIELFRRSTRRVELTEAGELLLARASRVLAEVEGARQELSELTGLLRGHVSLGSLPLASLGVPAMLEQFRDRHAGVGIHLHEQAIDVILPMLRRDELDLAFAMTGPDEVGAGLTARILYEEELVAVMSTSHELAARKSVRVEQLADDPLIGFRPGSALRRAVDDQLARADPAPDYAFETFELETIRSLASHGLGVALLPAGYLDPSGPKVASAPLRPRVRIPISLAWRTDRRHTPAAEAFLEFARARFSQRPR
jgi:DNA-binding transcriptional LysR family regulator